MSSYLLAKAFAAAATVTLVALVTPVSAAKVHAPLGYQLMCLKVPQECLGGGEPQVTLTDEVMLTLKRVNARVNHTITPKYDQGGDVWSVNATMGDCEDYVLTKRRALIEAGLPASSLRIAYVKTRKGDGHAILVVKTNAKDLVLDNLTATILPLSQSGYRIISMSGVDPRNWT